MSTLTFAELRKADVAELRRLVDRYPWWIVPRLLLTRKTDTPCPVPVNPLCRPELSVEDSDPIGKMIETFLTVGEHRIVPSAGTTDEDLAARPTDDGFPDDLVTEELAEIYLAQGLTEQALDIYRRLSLLFPEKSVYFAKIIARNDNK